MCVTRPSGLKPSPRPTHAGEISKHNAVLACDPQAVAAPFIQLSTWYAEASWAPSLGLGFNPLGRVTHIPPSDRLRKQGGHVLLRPRALQTAAYFTDRQARADFKAFDKIVKRRGGSKPGKAMNCRHRPTSVSTLICGLVLGNWPQSVLGMDRFRIADQPEVTERRSGERPAGEKD